MIPWASHESPIDAVKSWRQAVKLLFYDDFKLGVAKGNNVIDVMDVVKDMPHAHPQDLIKGLIERWDAYKGKLEATVAAGTGVALSSVRIRSPLPAPSTIVCMAVNYMENGTLPAPAPINAFHKTPHSVIGDGDTMILPDIPATIFEGEAEMALVFGKRGSNVSRADAMSYVFGYLNFIDGSARGLPPANNTFYQMKSRDTFCPMGPFLVTADEVGDPQNLKVQLWNNGDLKQDFNTNDMAHKLDRCIEWVTSIHPMEAGDVIATGTNHRGLHAFHDGDKVELEVEGLGRLHLNVRDDLKRSWRRDTRLERAQKAEQDAKLQISGKYA